MEYLDDHTIAFPYNDTFWSNESINFSSACICILELHIQLSAVDFRRLDKGVSMRQH